LSLENIQIRLKSLKIQKFNKKRVLKKISFLLTKYPIMGRKRPQQILILRHSEQYWRSTSSLCLQVSSTITFLHTQ